MTSSVNAVHYQLSAGQAGTFTTAMTRTERSAFRLGQVPPPAQNVAAASPALEPPQGVPEAPNGKKKGKASDRRSRTVRSTRFC